MKPSQAVPKSSSKPSTAMLEARKNFRLQVALHAIHPESNSYWEQVKCAGYNPQMQRLEAVVDIKQSTGYGGGLCSNATREYLRFYVDFQDGGGFRDMGLTSFKSADIPNVTPRPEHPLSYMVYLYTKDEEYRRFIDCTHAVIPRLRVILSWDIPPTPDAPNYVPHYGNVLEVDVQLEKLWYLIVKEAFEFVKYPLWKKLLPPDLHIPLPHPPLADVKELYVVNKKAGVPDHRTFFSTVGAAIESCMDFSQAAAQFNVADLSALKIDATKLISLYSPIPNEQKGDVSFEELRCIGLNPDTDTLGAVVQVKKSTGYSGDLCHKGSLEHIAFWADWDNDGKFDQYLGTVSFETHDISNIPPGGLCYNVTLPFDVSKRLKPCETPNIIRIRGVLSWEALPSTTNPNTLNTWGNSIDALVQLRPGQSYGMYTVITLVGNVDRGHIHPTQHLYNYDAIAPSVNNNRPWGGTVNFCGVIDRNGYNGKVYYRLLYKTDTDPDTAFQPVSYHESFGRWQPPGPPANVSQTADRDGWYLYDVNPALGIFDVWDNGLLANLRASSLPDGHYTILFECKDESGNTLPGDRFSIVICNAGMSVSPTANTAVDTTKNLDLVIDGGDCHSYNAAHALISGHLRATHPYFGWWILDLQPESHTQGARPSPASRYYSSVGDTGDANAVWTLDTTPLDPCGYTVSLSARTRVILNSSPGYFPYYGPKAVGFAKQP